MTEFELVLVLEKNPTYKQLWALTGNIRINVSGEQNPM